MPHEGADALTLWLPPRLHSEKPGQASRAGRRRYNVVTLISVVQLGRLDYASGLRVQQKLVELRKGGQIGDVLLLLEHTPVITLGRNAKAANVLASPERLAIRGVEVFECDRGGDVTFHGPGQLVGYPIFDLRGFDSSQLSALSSQERPGRKTLGAVDYVRRLEEVLICTCADFGIPVKRVAGLTGVWAETEASARANADSGASRTQGPSTASEVLRTSDSARDDNERKRAGDRHSQAAVAELRSAGQPRAAVPTPEAKIAAIGVHISRSVTSHGFALNVNTDLSYFDLIVPCGIAVKPVTSMQRELGRELDLTAVAESVARNFGIVFGQQMVWVETLDAVLGSTVGVPVKAPAELRKIRGEEDLFLA